MKAIQTKIVYRGPGGFWLLWQICESQNRAYKILSGPEGLRKRFPENKYKAVKMAGLK